MDSFKIFFSFQGGKSVENNKRKVFVGGLPSDVTDQQLKEIMSKYGPVSILFSILCLFIHIEVIHLSIWKL
jgi:RNA recognition motif-containing protein